MSETKKSSSRKKIFRDPVVVWEGPIASREIDHSPRPVSYITGDRARPIWITHYLCCVQELDEKRTKKSGLTIVKRRWYLTIDGSSKTFIPEHKALLWLLSKVSTEQSKATIISLYECDLIRTINLG